MKANRILALTLTALSAAALAGCSPKIEAGGEQTIQIRAYNGGYGIEWLKVLATQFEKTFPQYKVNIVEASSMVTEAAVNEIMVPKNNEIDLYFTNGGKMYDLIGSSQKVLKTNKKVLLEELSDVYNSPAIGFDGKEESQTIAERMFDGYKEYSSYHTATGTSNWENKMYKLPWADALTGIFCNKSVLDKYGLEIPLTSKEFENVILEVAKHTATDKIYPYSWAGSNCAGYWSYLFETWFAQYSGAEKFWNFQKCDPGDGDIENNGWKVYEDKGILEALKAMYPILDIKYSSPGSNDKTHMQSQNEFFRGLSAFVIDGDWILTEMKADYYEQAKETVFVPAPILSVIGEESGITDAQLHNVVKAIDEGKTDAEVKQLVPEISLENINRIRIARGVHDGIGTGHDMQIPSYADAKDAAKLFIRFFYSNDGCRVFRNYAAANLPLTYTTEEGDTNTPFQQSLDNFYKKGNISMVSDSGNISDVRAKSLMYIFNVSEWNHPNTYKAIMFDKDSSNPTYSAQYIYEQEAAYMKKSWSNYMSFVF